MKKKYLVDWYYATGKCCLEVAGYIVAIEGDPVRDISLSVHKDVATAFGAKEVWTKELIKKVVKEAQKQERYKMQNKEKIK